MNKIDKYSIRLKKSFLNNNPIKYKEYLSHLKFHLGAGGGPEPIDFSYFDNLLPIIKEKSKALNKEKENEIATLKFDSEVIQQQIDELQRIKEKNKYIIIELENQLKNIKIDFRDTILSNSQLAAQKVELEGILKEYETNLEKNNDDINILQNKLEETQKKFQQSQTEIQQYTQKILAQSNEIERLTDELEKLKQTYAKLEEDNLKLKQENAELKEDVKLQLGQNATLYLT